MNKNRRLKKGFTLVELVVVIAVIAILAAVSVGAYFGITESANRSADEQAVTQLNKMLETYEILTGRVDDVEEAKDIFEDNGVTNYTPFFDKNTFYWTYADSRVIIWTEGKGVTFPSWAAENYKSYSEQPSVDWYDLNRNSNEIFIEANEQHVINYSDLYNEVKNATENPVISLEENSTLDVGQARFTLLGNAFRDNSNIDTLEIDLGGSTLENDTTYSNGYMYSIEVPSDKTLIIENGTYNITFDNKYDYLNAFTTRNGAKLVLRNMTITLDCDSYYPCSAVYAYGDSTEIIVENCTIKGFTYGIGTNAMQSSQTTFKVKDTHIEAQLPIFLNVPGTIHITGSKLYATQAAIVAKSGSVYAKNTYMFTSDCTTDSIFYYKNYSSWYGTYGDGGKFPTATVILGNYSKSFDNFSGNVFAQFEGCKFEADNRYNEITVPHMILSADNWTSVKVNYSNCEINSSMIVQYDVTGECNETCGVKNGQHHEFGCRLAENNGTIEINGTVYNYTDNKYNG